MGTDPGLTLEEFRKKGKLKQGSQGDAGHDEQCAGQAAEAVSEEGSSGGDGDAAEADL